MLPVVCSASIPAVSVEAGLIPNAAMLNTWLKRIAFSLYGGPDRDSIFSCCAAVLNVNWLSVARHTGVLDVTTVGFTPAGELALVDGAFGADTRHVVHPYQTRTYTRKHRGCLNFFY